MRGPSGSWRSVVAWAVLILIATTISLPDVAFRATAQGLDKLVHGSLYLVLGWLVGAALCAMGRRDVMSLGLALLSLAVFALLDEAHQYWLPGRVASTGDWAADVIGATIGLTAGVVLWNVLQPPKRRSAAEDREEH